MSQNEGSMNYRAMTNHIIIRLKIFLHRPTSTKIAGIEARTTT